MFSLKTEDFESLEQFKLLWRWTDPECAVLPKAILSQIHVLLPSKARQVEEHIYSDCHKLSLFLYNPIPEDPSLDTIFEVVQRIEIIDQSNKFVYDWFMSLEVPTNITVLVSWEQTVAVTVSWQIFCQYWSDFCYPGSDDICISSLCGTWRLVYYHENIFLFGKLKSSQGE